MDDNLNALIARRDFLRRGACASLGMAGVASQLFTLRTVQAALLDTNPTDFRAAVCIFLFGGNDSANMLVPWDGGAQNFADYAQLRGAVALTPGQASGQIVAPANTQGRRFAFHPAMSDVAALFNQGAVSLVNNVGTLVEPATREQVRSESVRLPAQLFAHNVQQEQWQISTADAADRLGWGGRVADALHACGVNEGSPISMNISLAGANFFLSGRQVTPYVATPNGAPDIETNFGNGDDNAITAAAYADLLAVQASETFAARSHLRKAYADIARQAVSGADTVNAALAVGTGIGTPVPPNGLSAQLYTVARLIEQAQPVLGQTRQIYFVAIGGFDTHNGQIGADATSGQHAGRLAELNSGIRFFWDALGDIGMRDRVTTFTASDFGRTYLSNGDGTDHGWGADHIVMGGSQLAGGRMAGAYPDITPEGPDDARSNGRFIPTTSVDQYGYEIARWLGLPLSEAATVFPNLTRFLDPADQSTHLGLLT
jgi:uncharacterized protein (DUF1501 family)